MFFSKNQLKSAQKIVIINQNLGISTSEILIAQQIASLAHVSAGFLAVLYFFNRGAKKIDLIGFGYLGGDFLTGGKKYCKHSFNYPDGMTDNNPRYDFNIEHKILQNLPTVTFL